MLLFIFIPFVYNTTKKLHSIITQRRTQIFTKDSSVHMIQLRKKLKQKSLEKAFCIGLKTHENILMKNDSKWR